MSRLFPPPGGVGLPPPAPPRACETVVFGAPVGRRVRLITILIAASFVLFAAGNVVLWSSLRLPSATLLPMTLAPLAGLAVVVPIYFHQRVLGYGLEAEAIAIHRHGRVDRLPLAGLCEAAFDPDATAWSLKLFGNDGLGAITGRFRNTRLGPYRAYITDRARTVVLRWPDRCVVLSPDRPEEFVAELRRRAGLRN